MHPSLLPDVAVDGDGLTRQSVCGIRVHATHTVAGEAALDSADG